MYSLGVIFFMMLFYDRDLSLWDNFRKVQNFLDLMEKNRIDRFDSENISKECIEFLKMMLENNPKKRLTSDEALAHRIFAKKNEKLP